MAKDMLGLGAAFLAANQRRYAAVSVEYRRGGDTAVVPAVIGQTVRRTSPEAGGGIERTDRDWLIVPADLVINGEQVEPAAEDLIVETVGDKTRTYEVRPAVDEPAWRWSDPRHSRYRIHTKLLLEAAT